MKYQTLSNWLRCLAGMVLIFIFSASVEAGVYWTLYARSILVNATGIAAINIGTQIPTGPNPPDSVWESCKSNWIYFHENVDGVPVEDKYINRMLAVAVTAYKTNSRIRVNLERSVNGKCYTAQIFDQGQ